MNYLEALLADGITKDEARREIERHQCDFAEFLREVGDKDEYTGEEILAWLGY